MIRKALFTTTLFALIATNVGAQALGLPVGRTANIVDEAKISLDFGAADDVHRFLGIRGNYKVGERLLLFGEVGRIDLRFGPFKEDVITYGVGAVYQFDFDLPVDTGIKVGYNTADALGFDFGVITALAVASSDVPSVEGLSWYANAGVYHLSDDFYDGTDLGVGVGIVYDISETMSVFGGIDKIDGTSIGAGLRWSFGRRN